MSGGIWTFNVKDGYCEALLRGLRQSLLTPDDYRRLGLADTLEDLRTSLEETDYGNFLQDEPMPIAVTTIAAKCREKMAREFFHLRAMAGKPLVQFLDYIVQDKMIDNVVNLMQGALNRKTPEELLSRVDPLGWIPEMQAIAAVDVSSGYGDLYRSLLIDTPVGPYFEQYLAARARELDATNNAQPNSDTVETLLNDADLEYMRSMLKKCWLESFYEFTQSLGGITAEVMGHMLRCEADFRILSVTLNTLNSQLGQASRLPDRNSLYPSFGYLYPEGVDRIRKAWNYTTVRAALEPYPQYLALFEECKNFYNQQENPTGDGPPVTADQKALEDVLFRESIKMCEMAFEQQFHYGIFYAWIKLKEQEIRNIVWIADLLLMNQRQHLDHILPIFAPRY